MQLGGEGNRCIAVIVPASVDGPHLIYRGEHFGAPVRNNADTVWMKNAKSRRHRGGGSMSDRTLKSAMYLADKQWPAVSDESNQILSRESNLPPAIFAE